MYTDLISSVRNGNKPATRGYPPRPAPKKPAPPRPVYVIGYRVGYIFYRNGFYRVLNGSGFMVKPESDPNYLKKKKKKTLTILLQSDPNLSVSLFSDLTRPVEPLSESLLSYPTVETSPIVHLIGRFLGALTSELGF